MKRLILIEIICELLVATLILLCVTFYVGGLSASTGNLCANANTDTGMSWVQNEKGESRTAFFNVRYFLQDY